MNRAPRIGSSKNSGCCDQVKNRASRYLGKIKVNGKNESQILM